MLTVIRLVRSGVWGTPGGRGGAMGWGMSGGRGGQGGRSGAVYIKHKTIIKTEKGRNKYFMLRKLFLLFNMLLIH